MDNDIDVKSDEIKQHSSEIDRTTSESSQNSTTIIKYITPHAISSRISQIQHGSLNNIIDLVNINSNYSPTTTAHGLATFNLTRYSTIPSIHSINGERMIDELRELSHLTETLANTILDYCKLVAHNRAQELQIEWLNNHNHENNSTMEKIFRKEIENIQKILADSRAKKSVVEMKLNEILQTAMSYDEQYKQLLTKRTQFSRELFDLERQIAQNNAESQFLKRRIHHFDEQIKFYLLKNHLLHERKVRLRYELDQELFSHQSLKMELEILEKDKITNEDIHASTLDDLHQSLDISQQNNAQSLKSFSQQLTHEIQRIRNEYEKKIDVYREELHRKFELEFYRYQIQKSNSLPTVTREHHLKFEQYQRENNDVLQQIAAIRGSINEIILQIESFQKQIQDKTTDQSSNYQSKKRLEYLNKLIQDRQRQLEDILQIRTSLKNDIDNYKKQFEYYSKQRIINRRISIQEFNHQSTRKSTSRLSLQEPINFTEENLHSLNNRTRSEQRKRHVSIVQIEDIPEEGTLIRFTDFNINQDCEELHRLLTSSNIDESSIIRILCNRSIGQRLQIREKYKHLFHQNLGDILEILSNKNLSQLLRILLLSPIEFDCFELRRIFKSSSNDRTILLEIIFTRSNKHLQTIRDTYPTLFKKTLEQEISNEKNNSIQEIYYLLLQSNRSEDNRIDDNEIIKNGKELYETQSTWKTMKSTLLRLLYTRSNSQLKSIFHVYQQYNSTDIAHDIQLQTDGNLQHTLLTIVQIIQNTAQYFAYELKNNFQSTTLNFYDLNRVIVSRCEIDMIQIKNEYEKLFQQTLYDDIQSNTCETYKQALLELIRQRTLSDVIIRYPFGRSSDDHKINRQRSDPNGNHSFNSSFHSQNQTKNDSLSTMTRTNQRSFGSQSTIRENQFDEFS